MEMKLADDAILPFNFTLAEQDGKWQMNILNATESILLEDITFTADSIKIKFPVFESELLLDVRDSSHLAGVWINYYKGPNYQIPVNATFGDSFRFSNKREEFTKSVGGTYEVSFSPNTADAYDAIGLFEQSGNDLTGTFATETGDYRQLDGNFVNDSIFLSTFDGSHAFLFKASYTDSLVQGVFWSGSHFKESWEAKINYDATLKNPDSLTFLKEGYDRFNFSFPDENGSLVSLDDDRFKDKVVIVQIMGSWCPNCLDETNYLSSLYKEYNAKGLEVVALAFERTKTKEKALKNLKNLKKKTAADYPFLLAGATRDDQAEEKLPMLNHIMSYPTAIFIDKQGKIQRIHTGFYGPSTGKYYTDFAEETERLVKEMLK
jgi:thiol-disulfide isomerase/thioredoxin